MCSTSLVRLEPQWSRSRRSGATRTLAAFLRSHNLGLNGAAPEGAERRRRRPEGAPACRDRASMEPLPKERSDLTTWFLRLVFGLDGAAPEGAERRGRESGDSIGRDLPQWSRSRRSGATKEYTKHLWTTPGPQWSRSRRSGATPHRKDCRCDLPLDTPQWSRSRRSGATTVKGCRRLIVSLPQWSRSRRSGATRLLGLLHRYASFMPQWSRPEGAERL